MSEDPILSDWDLKRRVEALLFASDAPMGPADLAPHLPEGCDLAALIDALAADYRNRGVELVRVAGRWQFRTAPDLAFLMRREVEEPRRLSRAAVETLAIVAYHQPVSRAEIEEIRGVAVSKGTLDVLLEVGWIKPRGRRQSPGRPTVYGTTETFLVHFGLDGLDALPGLKELQASGLLDSVDEALEDLSARAERDGHPGQIDLEEAIDAAAREAGQERHEE